MGGSVVFARRRQCASPSSTPQSASTPYRCCRLPSRFHYSDRRTCSDIFWAGHFPPPQNCALCGPGPTSNTCSLGPMRVHGSNGISIGLAVFAWLTIVTDRQTDKPTDRPRYLVCNNKPHLRSTAIWGLIIIISITTYARR